MKHVNEHFHFRLILLSEFYFSVVWLQFFVDFLLEVDQTSSNLYAVVFPFRFIIELKGVSQRRQSYCRYESVHGKNWKRSIRPNLKVVTVKQDFKGSITKRAHGVQSGQPSKFPPIWIGAKRWVSANENELCWRSNFPNRKKAFLFSCWYKGKVRRFCLITRPQSSRWLVKASLGGEYPELTVCEYCDRGFRTPGDRCIQINWPNGNWCWCQTSGLVCTFISGGPWLAGNGSPESLDESYKIA